MATYKTSGSAKRGAGRGAPKAGAKGVRQMPASKMTAAKYTGLRVQPVRNPKMTGVWQSNPSAGLKVRPVSNPAGQFSFNPQLGQPPLQMTTLSAPRLTVR